MAAPTYSPTTPPLHVLVRPALLAVASAAVIAVTWLASGPVLDAADRGVEWLQAHENFEGRVTLTAALLLVAVLAPSVVWLRASGRGRPVRLPGGGGHIPLEDLARWLRDTLEMRHDIREADVRVQNLHRRGVRVSATLSVTPDARLAETTAGAEQAIEGLLRSQVGVRTAGTPALAVRYEELVLRARPQSAHG